jgi:hypothetical protein
MGIISWWRRNFLLADYIPSGLVALGLIVAIVSFDGYSAINSFLGPQRSLLFSTVTTIFATLLGLMVATLALTMSLPKVDRLLVLADSGQLPVFIETLLGTTRALAVATPFALLALLSAQNTTLGEVSIVVLFSTSTLVLIRMYRSLHFLGRVLVASAKPW